VVTIIISSTVHNYRNIETMLCDRGVMMSIMHLSWKSACLLSPFRLALVKIASEHVQGGSCTCV